VATRRGPDGSVRVAISGTISGEPWTNVFWCNLGGGNTATQADLNSWNTAFYNAFGTNLCPQLNGTISATSCTATLFQNVNQALHAVSTSTKPGTEAGTRVGDISACRVLSWLSNVYWRGGKPRTYLAGLATSETTDGKNLTPAAITALAAAANAFHTAVNALSSGTISQTQHGFCSFMTGGVERNPGVFFPITGAAVHPRLGSQRGRLGAWKP